MIFFAVLFVLFSSPALASDESVNPAQEFTGKQRDYYVRFFNYAMNYVKPEKSLNWNSGTGKGIITIGEDYISKSKALCRDFKEEFEIKGREYKRTGTACRRDDDKSWCNIKVGNPHTCALEEPQGAVDKIMNNVESAIGSGAETLRNTKDWFR